MPYDVEVPEVAKMAPHRLKVTVNPEVELGDYKSLEATKSQLVVEDFELTNKIKCLRETHATSASRIEILLMAIWFQSTLKACRWVALKVARQKIMT